MGDREDALARSRAELRPLAEWFWDALDGSEFRTRNELATRSGYGRNLVYALFDGLRLPNLDQVRDLAQALEAEQGEVDQLWRQAKRANGSAGDLAEEAPATETPAARMPTDGMPTDGMPAGETPEPAGDSRWARPERLRRPRRLVLAAIAAVTAVAVGTAVGLHLASANGDEAVMARGDIAMVREGAEPRLIFPLPAGGIGYCTRADDDWSRPWAGLKRDTSWPGVSAASIFFSSFSGFEVLGDNNGTLTFGYRDPAFHWHGPKSLIDDQSGEPITGVAGRPGFFEYQTDPGFLALVPVDSGGLDLYRRVGISQRWQMMGSLDKSLGRISSVSLNYLPSIGISVILRIASRLYEQTRSSRGLPGGFATGWSQPRELTMTGSGPIEAAGDPALIYSDFIGNVADNTFWLAVPTRRGLALLSTRHAVSGSWSAEAAPLHQKPDSVALLEGYANGRPDVELAYRKASRLYSLWQPDGQAWHDPTLIRC
jgi:hypothetical protein